MTKVSESRSALRRLVLTKAAKDSAQQALDAIWDGYAAKHRGFTRSLTSAQATMNKLHERGLSAPGSGVAAMGTTAATLPRRPVAAPQSSARTATSSVWDRQPLYKSVHVHAPKDYPGATFLDGAEKVVGFAERVRNSMLRPVKPVISGIFKR